MGQRLAELIRRQHGGDRVLTFDVAQCVVERKAQSMSQRRLVGYRLLLVEDEPLIADDTKLSLEDHGAEILGPAQSLRQAAALLQAGAPVTAAILNIKLRDETVFPLADTLSDHAIPFAFFTGYDRRFIPARYAHIPVVEKPFPLESLIVTLLALGRPGSVRREMPVPGASRSL